MTEQSGVWNLLERAALEPERRAGELERALAGVAGWVSAAGTALIRPRLDGETPWQVSYAGERRAELLRWLRSRLDASTEVTAQALMQRAPCFPGIEPVLFPLHPREAALRGFWVLWPRGGLAGAERLERFRQALESFLEVEHLERLYFRGGAPLEEELADALRNRDEQGLPALLTLARAIGDADLTYWGSVHDELVDVKWHLGARDAGFGFELPLGEGVGGRAFAGGAVFEIEDYQNCRYRYPGVSDVTDEEQARSVLAIPVRSSTPQTGAVLYAVRREVAPFSPARRTLLLRLARGVEPVPELWPAPRHLFVSGRDHLKVVKSELRRILLHSTQVRDLELWLERLVRGPAICVDSGERPYVFHNLDRLERLCAGRAPQTVPLDGSGDRGRLYLWPSVNLPLAEWPDLLDDAAVAAGVIIDRMEHAYNRLNHQRSRWLQGVAEGNASPQAHREGNHLGLAVDRGEVWVFAWTAEKAHTRLKMLAEDAVLDLLGDPLVVLEDGLGVVLRRSRTRSRPSAVRDELLKYFGPDPLWLVHGAAYDTFGELKDALLHAVGIARRARREDAGRYVLEVSSWGLDSLLENPRLGGELAAFAQNLLSPLLAYDREHGSELTRTFCLALALGSSRAAAERLFVHENTVRYRVRRAEQILGRDLERPKERTALSLAAFAWLRRNPVRSA